MNKQRIFIGGVIVAFAAVGLLLYTNRPYNSDGGVIELTGAPEGSTIFLDNKRKKKVLDAGEPLSFSGLSVGTHTIVVAKDGYWPWSKKLLVANNEHIPVSAFAIPQEPVHNVLTKTDKQYESVHSAIENYTLPSVSDPLTSSNSTTKLWVADNAILAEWVSTEKPSAAFCITGTCESRLVVLPADLEIRDLSFLPGRSDVILFAAQNGIFALELDKRGIQNFEPVYLGVSPQFALLEGNVLAVKDEAVVFLIHF